MCQQDGSASRAKTDDGSVEALELSDLPELGAGLEAELAQTLAEEDVEHLAAAMDPGSVAGVLICCPYAG